MQLFLSGYLHSGNVKKRNVWGTSGANRVFLGQFWGKKEHIKFGKVYIVPK